jgi:hypothetical protein
MDITIKRTNRNVFQVDNTLALLLLEAFPDAFEKHEKPAPPPISSRKPEWGIGRGLETDRPHILLKTPLGEVIRFDGEPEQAAGVFKRWGWQIPTDVVEAYARAKNLPVPCSSITDSERAGMPYRGTTNTGW